MKNLFHKIVDSITIMRADNRSIRAHELSLKAKCLEEEALTLRSKSRALHCEARTILNHVLIQQAHRHAVSRAIAPYKVEPPKR